MGMFRQLFGYIERTRPSYCQPLTGRFRGRTLLKQTSGYPWAYRKAVMAALEYAHNLSQSVPGPVAVNPDTYAKDAYVHAIFPSMDTVSEAFQLSRSLQSYLHEHPIPMRFMH